MKRFSILILLALLTVLTFGGGTKNVIMFIGDGMGFNHVLLTSYLEGKTLNMMKAPDLAACTTYAADSNVTGSAAAGTALSTGFKTNMGMLGVLPDGTPVPNIVEIASANGVRTGIVATCRVTHATPAAFYGHVTDRVMEAELAEQLVNSPLDVVFGGGSRYLDPTSGKTLNGKDLITEAKNNGFDYITTIDEMNNYDGDRVIGLFSNSHFESLSMKPATQPGLPEMVSKAIDVLSKDEEPFFLMVEGSQIDWEAHNNDIYGIWKDIVEMDDAIKVALDFAADNSDTLIVITADHETGGLGLSTGEYTMGLDKIRKDFTKDLKWVTANYDFTDQGLKNVIKDNFNIDLTDKDLEVYHNDLRMWSYANATGKMLSEHVLIGWTTHEHTGALVPLFAFGAGSEEFHGIMDNTNVPRKIGELAGYEMIYPTYTVPMTGNNNHTY